MDLQKYGITVDDVRLNSKSSSTMLSNVYIIFSINSRRYKISYQYDPYHDELFNCSEEQLEKSILPQLVGTPLLIRVGVEECAAIMKQVIVEANHILRNNNEIKQKLPSLQIVIERVNKLGFSVHKTSPDFHCSKKTPFGEELHIYASSVTQLIRAIDDYEFDDFIVESYDYRAISERCALHWDVNVSTDDSGLSWWLYGADYEKDEDSDAEIGGQFCERYYNLRDLDKAANYRLSCSKVDPDPAFLLLCKNGIGEEVIVDI